jgi:hypothetical protein
VTRRDYVLITKAMAEGFAQLAKENKARHPDAVHGDEVGPSAHMEGFIHAMGTMVAALAADNPRFDPFLFFENVSKMASALSGDEISLVAMKVEDAPPEAVQKARETADRMFGNKAKKPGNGGTIH